MKKFACLLIAFIMIFSLASTSLTSLAFTVRDDYEGGYRRKMIQFDEDLWWANRAVSRASAVEGMVLLENEGNGLPIAPGTNIALFGYGARTPIFGGTGSGAINYVNDIHTNNTSKMVALGPGLRAAGLITDPVVDSYYSQFTASFGEGRFPTTGQWEGLVDGAAARNDTAIYVITRQSGESADRQLNPTNGNGYNLTANELANIQAVRDAFDTLVIVLNVGAVCEVGWVESVKPDAVLLAGLGGMEAGNALGDVVTGIKNPSGKTSNTWPNSVWDFPSSTNFSSSLGTGVGQTSNAVRTSTLSSNGLSATWGQVPSVAYVEDIYVGYRYFETFDKPVRYEFGFGLSYTDFRITNQSASIIGDELVATATVTNIGEYPGKEVIQVYMSAPDGILEKPAKELKGFAKTDELNPGQSQTITIKTPIYWLASYEEVNNQWILDVGTYDFYVGNSVKQVVKAGSWNLAYMRVVEQLTARPDEGVGTKAINFPKLSKFMTEQEQAATLARFVIPVAANPTGLVDINGAPLAPKYPGYSWTGFSQDDVYYANWVAPELARTQPDFRNRTIVGDRTFKLIDVYNGACTMDQFMNQFSAEDIAELFTDPHYTASPENMLRGAAFYTWESDFFGIPMATFPDGPAGLRIIRTVSSTSPNPDDRENAGIVQEATMFPQGWLQAMSWNVDMVYNSGHAIGTELVHFGGTWWLAPGMNLHRNPMCGRNFEYYSEDPMLSGTIAGSIARGVASHGGVSACLKHFYANNQEANRNTMDTLLSARAARELYLRNFEYALKEKSVRLIITSYNMQNGVHPNHNVGLIRGVVNTDWGYDGLWVWDYGAYGDGYQSRLAGIHQIQPRNTVRLIGAQNFSYHERAAAQELAAEFLSELMTTRTFTEPQGLPTHYYDVGDPTITVLKTNVVTSQTAGIKAPAIIVGNAIDYTVTLDNILTGSNLVTVKAQFDTALNYVGSQALIPGADIVFADVDAYGEYTATIALQDSLFTAGSVTDVLKISFNTSANSGSFTGELKAVQVVEVYSATKAVTVNCNLAPQAATSNFSIFDVDGDGKITLNDVALIIYNYYGVQVGDAKWDVAKDFDVFPDGIIDLLDIAIILTYVE